MMDVLASVRSANVLLVAIAVMVGTAVLCYVLAVGNGHVPAWLPMISDCAVYPPEKYIFRLGIVVGASLLGLQVVSAYYGDRARSKLCLTLGLVASGCLAVVGVVNEEEDHLLHDIVAIITFTCYDIYAVLMAYRGWKDPRVPRLSFFIKTCSSLIVKISLVGRYLDFVLDIKLLTLDISNIDLYLAMLEWTNFFALMIFFSSQYLDEPDNTWFAEVRNNNNIASKKQSIKKK